MPDLEGTIFGEMTYPGRSAMRAVRVSGPLSRKITKSIFASKADPWKIPRTAVGGLLRNLEGEKIDSILAIVFPSPNSYTGEDCAEFQCHGSEGVIRGLRSSLVTMGAREALPGEFSYRAFVHGKMTADEAENLSDLLRAETELEACAVGISGSGAVRSEILAVKDKILSLRAGWEARIDFPEDVPQPGVKTWRSEISPVLKKVEKSISLARRSRPVRDGFRVAIFGAPNSGKSSLFNCLLGRERAIVTPHPGTTRDIIEEKLDIEGLPMVFMDMAGARKKGLKIETQGISRAVMSAGEADAVMFLFDGSDGWSPRDEEALRMLDRNPLFLIAAKKDLYGKMKHRAPGKVLEISSRTGAGIDYLIRKLSAWGKRTLPKEGLFLMNGRQEECLLGVEAALAEAERALTSEENELFAAEKAREAQREIDRLLLSASKEEMYDLIFSGFCIGK